MRFFGTMLSRPIAWMGRRIIANHLRAALSRPKMKMAPKVPRPRYYDGVPAPAATMGHDVSVAAREKKIRKAQPREIFRRTVRPATVKPGGGLRGSAATKWA